MMNFLLKMVISQLCDRLPEGIYNCIPRPSKGVKFQPPGVFLVVKGLKFQTLGGFRYILLGCSQGYPSQLCDRLPGRVIPGPRVDVCDEDR